MKLTHLSLFTGIGGIDLSSEWAGFTTVGQCEMADYPYKVLCKHWPNVPKWRDVRDVTKESFKERTGIDTVDLISGGYPCQPFSLSGERKGEEDDRYLWPEMFKVIKSLRPSWVIGENVIGHVSMGLDDTLADLESIQYTCRTFVIPAVAVGARHRRFRVFIVANSNGERLERHWQTRNAIENVRQTRLARSDIDRGKSIWSVRDTDILRMDDGLSHRMDRVKCLGNAVVPQQVYPILKAIAEIENRRR